MKKKVLRTLKILLLAMVMVMAGNKTTCNAEEMAKLTGGQKIMDFLATTDDINSYQYVVDTVGYFTLNFSRGDPTISPRRGWDMKVYDAAGNLLCEYNAITTDYITPKLNFKQGTKINIEISANWKGDAPIAQSYGLQVYAVTNANWEVESMKTSLDSWESSISTATELTASKCYGSLWTPSDEDIYKLSVWKKGIVKLKFHPKNNANSVGWGYDVEIYKRNGDKLIGFKQLKTLTTKSFYVKEGTYYVVVKANWVYDAPDAYDEYAIAANVKLAAVPSMKSKKVSYVSKTATLNWKKVKDVDGYEVQLSRNPKFGKKNTIVYTTVESSYKLNRTLSKGNYFVRVRAYADTVTGDRLYGRFTKVKKIRKGKKK